MNSFAWIGALFLMVNMCKVGGEITLLDGYTKERYLDAILQYKPDTALMMPAVVQVG